MKTAQCTQKDSELSELLITVRETAKILGLSEKTIHNRGGNTHNLRRVRQGRSVRLICSEVWEHRKQLVEKATAIQREIYY